MCRKAPRLSFPTWCQYLEEVAATKKRNVNLIKTKLVECGPPGISGGTVRFLLKEKIFPSEKRRRQAILCKN